MKSRALIVVLSCLQIFLNVIDFSTAADEPNTANLTNSSNVDEHNKLLLECQHPDYRTYIKCLKRHKRHHLHSDHENEGGETRHKCFEECGMDECESTKCVHDCHKRCMKKTKETRQIITQYETNCESDDCKEDKKSVELPTTNITTNIDINNVINNHIPKNEVTVKSTGGGTTNTGGGTVGGTNGGSGTNTCVGNTPSCCGGTPCSGLGGWYGSNIGLTLVPQIQFVPQITFGLAAGGFAGSWQHGQTGGVDCSVCGNPLLRYRCDVSCYGVQSMSQVNQNTGRTGIVNSGCQSPQCVGGV